MEKLKRESHVCPLVSVIIPNYCHSRFLDERICSVLNQTYQNFEIIILDDCSPDNGASKAVIEKYRNNPKVSHIEYNTCNTGNTFLQWRKGIELSQGEIIWIAESDDSCLSNMLELLVEEYVKYKDCVIAYTSFKIANQNGVITTPRKKSALLYKLRELFTGRKHFKGLNYIKRYLTIGNLIENASTAIFSKEAAMSIPQTYVDYVSAGDYLFWIEMSKMGSVSFIDKQLSIFRRHEAVVTIKKDSDGTNFKVNKLLIDSLFKEYKFSKLRYRYCRSHQIFRIHNTKFDSEEIYLELLKMWDNNGDLSLFDKFVFNVGNFLFKRYKYLV